MNIRLPDIFTSAVFFLIPCRHDESESKVEILVEKVRDGMHSLISILSDKQYPVSCDHSAVNQEISPEYFMEQVEKAANTTGASGCTTLDVAQPFLFLMDSHDSPDPVTTMAFSVSLKLRFENDTSLSSGLEWIPFEDIISGNAGAFVQPVSENEGFFTMLRYLAENFG